jgi:hypothetical protein
LDEEKEEKKKMQGTNRQAIAFQIVAFHPFEPAGNAIYLRFGARI